MLERFSEEIPEMGGEILALDEAEGTGNIRSDLSRARQRSPAAKDPDPFRKFVLRTALARFAALAAILLFAASSAASPSTNPTIARIWNEEILAAIRIDLPHPPVHARNLFHLSVAMYDAWAAFHPTAVGYLHHQKHTAADINLARREAISYAAYRLLRERYALSRNSTNTLRALDARLIALGYDPSILTPDPSTPAGLGNLIAKKISDFASNDGAFQDRKYQDLAPESGGYIPANAPLFTTETGTLAVNPDRWQPLLFTNAISQNNLPVELTQKFLGAQWLQVRPFALARQNPQLPWFDPGPPPFLRGTTAAQYKSEALEVIRRSFELCAEDSTLIDISPARLGNNPLGSNDGTGHAANPFTAQPYPANLVKRADFGRVLAEYWADGPNSETPPGHWNSIANKLSDSPSFQKRFLGTGPLLDDLEWDVKIYFAINSAMHDAACAAWSLKRHYDSYRPISAIRFMGQLGQSSDPSHPTYDPSGLPLEPGLVEIVSQASAAPGGPHAGFPIGSIALRVWPGPPQTTPQSTSQKAAERQWILAADWMPYQKRTFVTPAFPGYISGHSTFSRAAAEVLTAITGSEFFPGGLATHTCPANTGLTVEQGPTATIQLQWATYFDAADQAGQSRLWGGIHVASDDFNGRRVGAQCGQAAWTLAQSYFNGTIARAPVTLTVQHLPNGQTQIQATTIRGFQYTIETTSNLPHFQPLSTQTAEDWTTTWTHLPTDPIRIYRALHSVTTPN
jgi:hypothetical protein